MSRPEKSPDEFVEGVLRGERRAVAKTITLLESSRLDHVELSRQVLEKLVPETGKSLSACPVCGFRVSDLGTLTSVGSTDGYVTE